MRILLVEDDPRMRVLVRRGLAEEGHTVSVAADGAEALRAVHESAFDAIVLDVMLPGRSGIDVVRALRARDCRTPVIMLTARDTHVDVVAGLDAGADDYLTKPFSFSVLVARLRALARRVPSSGEGPLSVAGLVLDTAGHVVRRHGVVVALTPTEFSLLECLMRRPGRVISRRALIDQVWGVSRDVENNTLDAFVRTLRQKVDVSGQASIIRTVRGVGYMIGEEPGT